MQVEAIQDVLSTIFGGKTLDELRYSCACFCCEIVKPSRKELEPHHVTYDPSVVKYLCHECHARITFLNHKKALRCHRKLSNEDRLAVWEEFLDECVDEDELSENVEWFNSLEFT